MFHLNTPRLVADATGTTVWRWDQAEPFGDSAPNEDPDGDSVAFGFPMRFPGQYADTETNLAYNYFRDYAPEVGGFVEADPLGVVPYRFAAQRLSHPYAYTESNPLTFVDLLGLCPCPGGVWDEEFGDFSFNVGIGGYFSGGNIHYTCRSNPSIKCSGKQIAIGAGTPGRGINWALGGVQFGANDSNDISGWSGSGVLSGWYLGGQSGFVQGQISLSGQGGGTAVGLPRGFSIALFKTLNYYMKCTCPTCK